VPVCVRTQHSYCADHFKLETIFFFFSKLLTILLGWLSNKSKAKKLQFWSKCIGYNRIDTLSMYIAHKCLGCFLFPELTGGSQDIFANPPTNKQSFFNAVQSTAWIGRFTTFNDYSPLYTQAVVCMYAGNIKDFTNITRNQRIILDVLTDGFFVAPGVVHANDYVHRGVKTFFYHAMYGLPMPNLFKIPNVVNAYHETEKFMVFGFSLKGRVKLYSGGSKLSREVIKMWSNFAKTG